MIESPERIKDCDKLVGHILSMQYRPAQVNKAWKFAQRYFQLGYDLGMRKARAKQQHLTHGSMAPGASAPSAQICPSCKGEKTFYSLSKNAYELCGGCGGSGKLYTA